MPIKKGLKPYAKKTEATKEVRPRLEIVECILMHTAPKWDAKKKKFLAGMTLKEACELEGISDMTLRNWRAENEKIANYFNEVRSSRKEMAHSMMEEFALNNVMDVIGGSVKVRPMDKVNVSLRYLEKTSPEFNPAMKIDVESTNTNYSMTSDEMTQRIMELSSALGILNPIDNEGTEDGGVHTDAGTPSDNE